MLFNSSQFLIFFPIVTLLYFVLPHNYRWFMLLIASCIFYMAFIPVYILILFVLILIDYFAGILIERASDKKHKKIFLIISIVATCLTLFIFKYFNFFNMNFSRIAELLHWNYPIGFLSLLLPIGLSFHTFQSLSYVIEVYKGRYKAERNLGIYSLYVMFYPQLVAGPIERPANLLHQFYEKHSFEYKRVTDGLKLMAWGMFKKVVIADRMASYVNLVYGDPGSYDGVALVISTLFFAYQIYCDFSGYTDIAIGAAQVMGFKLMDNFAKPYFAKSISEFWRRWNISLSSWFRDYVYIPLGGSKVVKWKWYFNLFITFLISGLWHGANWTYVLWGAINGVYIILGNYTQAAREKMAKLLGFTKIPVLHRYLKVVTTFCLVCFAWIFFRANNISDAFYVVSHLFSGWQHFFLVLSGNPKALFATAWMGHSFGYLIFTFATIVFLEFVHLIQRYGSVRQMVSAQPWFVRWPVYYCFMMSILVFGVFKKSPFIYFQF